MHAYLAAHAAGAAADARFRDMRAPSLLWPAKHLKIPLHHWHIHEQQQKLLWVPAWKLVERWSQTSQMQQGANNA